MEEPDPPQDSARQRPSSRTRPTRAAFVPPPVPPQSQPSGGRPAAKKATKTTKSAPAVLFQPPRADDPPPPPPEVPPESRKPRKATTPRKAATPKQSRAKKATAASRTSERGAPAVALARVVDHPEYARELLAISAVETLGPGVRAWCERVRNAYPAASRDGLARLATRRFVRLAGVGAATATTAGLFAPLVALAAVAWTQAELTLHLAAIHGQDPADPDRAVELLVLTRVHPDESTARATLTGAREALVSGDSSLPVGRFANPLFKQVASWWALRQSARLLPGLGLLVAASAATATTERLAARATAHYRRA